jgi:hypothetical protein
MAPGLGQPFQAMKGAAEMRWSEVDAEERTPAGSLAPGAPIAGHSAVRSLQNRVRRTANLGLAEWGILLGFNDGHHSKTARFARYP